MPDISPVLGAFEVKQKIKTVEEGASAIAVQIDSANRNGQRSKKEKDSE